MKFLRLWLSIIIGFLLVACELQAIPTSVVATPESEPTLTITPQPTSTSEPSITYTPTPADCTQGWTRLEIGLSAKVVTSLRLRSEPSLGDNIIGQLYPGTPLTVLEGPVCAGNLVFWKVEDKSVPGQVGWMAEGDGQEYWLEPYAYVPGTVLPPSTSSTVVTMKYPGYDNCTIQVNTDKWDIGDVWRDYIVGMENHGGVVPISRNLLVYLVTSKIWPGCNAIWAPSVGFEESMDLTVSYEAIGGRNWEIWDVCSSGGGDCFTRVYFWEDLRDIRFMQSLPDGFEQECIQDVHEILTSLSCQ